MWRASHRRVNTDRYHRFISVTKDSCHCAMCKLNGIRIKVRLSGTIVSEGFKAQLFGLHRTRKLSRTFSFRTAKALPSKVHRETESLCDHRTFRLTTESITFPNAPTRHVKSTSSHETHSGVGPFQVLDQRESLRNVDVRVSAFCRHELFYAIIQYPWPSISRFYPSTFRYTHICVYVYMCFYSLHQVT